MARKGSNSALRNLVERVERLEDERKEIAGQITEVYGEAKAQGFDAKTMRRLIQLRKKPQAEREEEEALLETYMAELGMLAGTPLGEAALAREIQTGISALGDQVPLSDDEKAAGVLAAFVKDGQRMTITVPKS